MRVDGRFREQFARGPIEAAASSIMRPRAIPFERLQQFARMVVRVPEVEADKVIKKATDAPRRSSRKDRSDR